MKQSWPGCVSLKLPHIQCKPTQAITNQRKLSKSLKGDCVHTVAYRQEIKPSLINIMGALVAAINPLTHTADWRHAQKD